MNILKIQKVSPSLHKLLWICLLGLTIVIFVWPVAPSLKNPLPVQSIYAIKQLPWFIALFFVWVLNLAALLFLVKGSLWERLSLCLVFVLVFVQFWGFKASPWGNITDTSFLMGHVNYLDRTAQIPSSGHPILTYFDFPGLTLVGLTIKQLSGTDLFLAIRIYLILSGLIFVVVFYTGVFKLLKTPDLSAISVVVALVSSSVLGSVTNIFHPINLATIYIAVFFLILATYGIKGLSEQKTSFILLVLLLASTIEYIFTPVLFSIILLANYVFHCPAKSLQNIITIILSLVLFLSWDTYWTVWMFRSSLVGLPAALQAILNGKWLIPTAIILKENFGTIYPWWGNISKFFWWLSIFGFGTLLMLWRLFHWRRVDNYQLTESINFLGIIATLIIGSISVGVIGVMHGGILRYLWLAPFVLAPAMTRFLFNLKAKYLTIIFSIVSIILVLPTFLSYADNIAADHVYQNEITAFEFIKSSHEEGEKLVLYGFPRIPSVSSIYEPDANRYNEIYINIGINVSEEWNALQDKAKTFLASNHDANVAIFSTGGKMEWQRYFQIPFNDPNWAAVEITLADGNRIYDDGSLQLYVTN